jgi:hypothetical protein
MHVGDLDGVSSPVRKRWEATVVILVHDSSENVVPEAIVTGFWDGDSADSTSCVTDAAGVCTVVKSNIKSNVSSVAFAVSELSYSAMVYQAADNHDPDGDSDGSQITVWMP